MSVQDGNSSSNNNVEANEVEDQQEEHNHRNIEEEGLRIEDRIIEVDEDVEEVSLASGPTNHHNRRTVMGVDLKLNGTQLWLDLVRLNMDAFENLISDGYGNNINRVCLRMGHFGDESLLEEWMMAVLDVYELRTRPYRLGQLISRFLNMKRLHIFYAFPNGHMIAALVLQGLEEFTSLPSLSVSESFRRDDYDPAESALTILTGFVNGTSSLSSLSLSGSTFGTALSSALKHPACKLRVLALSYYNLTDDKWRSVMSFLGENKTLEHLLIMNGFLSETGGISGNLFLDTIKQIAENTESALQEVLLEVRNETEMATYYIEAVKQLSKNTTLKSLQIRVGDPSFSIDLDEDSHRQLMEAAQRNYGICDHGVKPHRLAGDDGSQMSELLVLGWLNKAGRRYLTMGPKFKSLAANVLSHRAIRCNPGAIFFHLQEHPELCSRNLSRV